MSWPVPSRRILRWRPVEGEGLEHLEFGPEEDELVARGYGTVLTGGGDGTFTVMVTEVVHEARRCGKPLPRFGLLKLGTGNSLAWVVGAQGADKHELQADIGRLIEDAGSRSMR